MCQADSSKELFSYDNVPLNKSTREIRLIRVFPARDLASQVQCEVFFADINESPKYESLSYTWGDPECKITTPILIHEKIFHARINLDLALRYLRYEDRERILWVDAICINQTDLAEKSSQLKMMRDIYTSAERVVVWLGEEYNAQVALSFLDQIESKLDDPYLDAVRQDTELDRFKWEALGDLFNVQNRPWWSRTWILQEVMHQRPVLV